MATHIIFDLNRTLYDPETDELVTGAREILDSAARRGVVLALISRREPGREGILARFGIAHYFVRTDYVSEKTPECFMSLLHVLTAPPEHVLVVGDHPDDIRCGNACGAITIRFRTGRFRDLDDGDVRPVYEIDSLEKLERYF